MQLKEFRVSKLFGQFDHKINLPTRPENSTDPSVLLLCGPNGIGKTRILRMIESFIKLDFNSFREVPFEEAALKFSDNSEITVTRILRTRGGVKHNGLRVVHNQEQMDLALRDKGSLFPDEADTTRLFREKYQKHIEGIDVQVISTARLQDLTLENARRRFERERAMSPDEVTYYQERTRVKERTILLGEKVKNFVREAQLNSGRFFAARDPGLFSRILENLTDANQQTELSVAELLRRIKSLNEKDKEAERYELFGERWNYQQLKSVLGKKGTEAPNNHALTVINTYIELLESRAAERDLLITRLRTFENEINSFLEHKTILVNAKQGILIQTDAGEALREDMLSSGEYHLLYLFVLALTTLRRGTVIAIDEPEISMHISWQRKLVPALVKCASSAQPQFIIATHSPDITASFPDNCEHLGDLEG